MAVEASIIVFSPLHGVLIDDEFLIKAEDIDGRLWTLMGPIPDGEIAVSFRVAQIVLVEGWDYLLSLRSKLSYRKC